MRYPGSAIGAVKTGKGKARGSPDEQRPTRFHEQGELQ